MRRPVNPVIPYPPEAVQHTRCVLALSMITVALSLLKSETLPQLGDLGRQVEKVDRWIERCSDDVQRKLSAGAKRDLDRRTGEAINLAEARSLAQEHERLVSRRVTRK